MPESKRPVSRAVVLAAGRGKRLGRLTADRPKPMIHVQGKPVLEWIVEGLVRTGFRELLLVIGYRGEAIRDHFGDGSRWSAHITYAEQPVPLGTGAALLLGRPFASGHPILCAFGDILTNFAHYRALKAEYDRAPCAAVLGLNWVDDPSSGGAVYREGGRVTRVIEKPPPGTSTTNWNLAGVHVFGPDIFDTLDRVAPSPRGEIELTSAITGFLDAGEEVRACELQGFWSDVGTPEALATAEAEWQPDSS